MPDFTGTAGAGEASAYTEGNPNLKFEFPTPMYLSMRLDETCFDCGDAVPLRDGRLDMVDGGPCSITDGRCSPGSYAYCDFEIALEDYGECLFQMRVTTTKGATVGHCFLLVVLQRILTDEDRRRFDEMEAACRDDL